MGRMRKGRRKGEKGKRKRGEKKKNERQERAKVEVLRKTGQERDKDRKDK